VSVIDGVSPKSRMNFKKSRLMAATDLDVQHQQIL
jgi:hypothetical protein